jgi:hypothetical protein
MSDERRLRRIQSEMELAGHPISIDELRRIRSEYLASGEAEDIRGLPAKAKAEGRSLLDVCREYFDRKARR